MFLVKQFALLLIQGLFFLTQLPKLYRNRFLLLKKLIYLAVAVSFKAIVLPFNTLSCFCRCRSGFRRGQSCYLRNCSLVQLLFLLTQLTLPAAQLFRFLPSLASHAGIHASNVDALSCNWACMESYCFSKQLLLLLNQLCLTQLLLSAVVVCPDAVASNAVASKAVVS